MTVRPWHVCVLIPARNEEELLPRCLCSVLASCSALPETVTWDVVVAVDRSIDRTFEIAHKMIRRKGIAVRSAAGIVGKARATAAAVALDRYHGRLRWCWLANTDADCVVPKGWLIDQLAIAETDIEAVAGTVDVDSFHEHSPCAIDRFRSSYLIDSDGSHPHVHGANLGIRADLYRTVGGWATLETAEDHDLWNRLYRAGARRASVSHTRVWTSGRRVGRAPHGFAEALAAHNEAAA
jgi:glycosyltransferase involved in cell wall biosynthesis